MLSIKYLFYDFRDGHFEDELKFICKCLSIVFIVLGFVYLITFVAIPKVKASSAIGINNHKQVVYSSEVEEFNSLATGILHYGDDLTNAEMVEKYNRLSYLMKSAVPYTPEDISPDKIYFNEFTVLNTDIDSMLGYMVTFTNGDTLYTPKETNLLLGDKVELYFTKETPNSLITNFTTIKEIK